jgi:hypothetical protein
MESSELGVIDPIKICKALKFPDVILSKSSILDLSDAALCLDYMISQLGEHIYSNENIYIPEEPATDGIKATIRKDSKDLQSILGEQTYEEILSKMNFVSSVSSHISMQNWQNIYIKNDILEVFL